MIKVEKEKGEQFLVTLSYLPSTTFTLWWFFPLLLLTPSHIRVLVTLACVSLMEAEKNCGKDAILHQAKDDGNAALRHDVVFRGFSSVLMKYKCAQSKLLIFFPEKKSLHLVWPNPCSFVLQGLCLVCCNLLAMILGNFIQHKHLWQFWRQVGSITCSCTFGLVVSMLKTLKHNREEHWE